MAIRYSFKEYDPEMMACSIGLSASVSTKHCVVISSTLRGKNISQARKILNEAIDLKKAIPYRRYNHNMGHKKGIGPGRYPVKACTEILKVIDSCEANAQNKGLNTTQLKIVHISANMASRPWHYGRARRRKTKRTHIQVVLEEKGKKDEPKKTIVAKD